VYRPSLPADMGKAAETSRPLAPDGDCGWLQAATCCTSCSRNPQPACSGVTRHPLLSHPNSAQPSPAAAGYVAAMSAAAVSTRARCLGQARPQGHCCCSQAPGFALRVLCPPPPRAGGVPPAWRSSQGRPRSCVCRCHVASADSVSEGRGLPGAAAAGGLGPCYAVKDPCCSSWQGVCARGGTACAGRYLFPPLQSCWLQLQARLPGCACVGLLPPHAPGCAVCCCNPAAAGALRPGVPLAHCRAALTVLRGCKRGTRAPGLQPNKKHDSAS
jgi:hypothetical protein